MGLFSFSLYGRWRWLLMVAFFCLFVAVSNIIAAYKSIIINTSIRSADSDDFTEIGFYQEPAFNPRKTKNHSRHSQLQAQVRNTSTIIAARSSPAVKKHDTHSHRKHQDLIPKDPNLAVLRLWQEYKSQHSKESLKEEWDYHKRTNTTTNRTFAIGFYSCPLQAGNRLHHFFNAVIWAVVTNRTILWKYYDEETCRIFGRQYSPMICKAANTEKDCKRILERAPWIPSLDQWWSRFGLKRRPELMSLWSFHEKSPKHKRWNDGDEKYQGLADITKSQAVVIAQMVGQDFKVMASKRRRNKLLLTEQARKRAKSLLSNGVDFLYGLVFRETFAFRKDVFPAFEVQVQTHSAPVTFALHSRHSKTSDDGSNVKREIKCLKQILKNHSNAESCQVYLLSDRPATLAALTDYLQERNDSCQGVVASHTFGKSFTNEHGPFAGIGYFQDLHLASQARHGFVGHGRSSSDLVRELMEYDRQMTAIQTDHWPLQELQTCKLP